MPKAAESVYRVIRIPQKLRTAIQTARDANEQTNEQFVATAVDKHLPQITEGLQKLGFGRIVGKTVPVRLPFSDDTGMLPALKDASELAGIPAVRLLSLCLLAAVSDATRPTKRRGRSATLKSKPNARRSSPRVKRRSS